MLVPFAMCRHRPLLLALACLSSALTAAAHAEDAEALIKRGVELRRAGRDQEALAEFRRANELAPSARALAQIGLAEQALGLWPQSEDDITKALASGLDPWIAKNRATLESALTAIAEHLGSLEILGEPAGAEVLIQGQVAGKLPLGRALRVTAGSLTIEVRAGDYVPVTRTVNVGAGQLVRENFTLLRVPILGTTGTTGAPTSTEPPRAPGTPPPPGGETSAERRPLPRTLAWVALGAGSAAAAAGIISLIVREVDARNYNTNCLHPNAFLTTSEAQQCSDWQSGGKTAASVAVVTFIAAGVLGAASAALFITHPSRKATETSAALSCAPTLATPGIACAAHF